VCVGDLPFFWRLRPDHKGAATIRIKRVNYSLKQRILHPTNVGSIMGIHSVRRQFIGSILERTTALGDDERDVIELGAGGELLDLFHNRSDEPLCRQRTMTHQSIR